jgi:hypothetical protein
MNNFEQFIAIIFLKYILTFINNFVYIIISLYL